MASISNATVEQIDVARQVLGEQNLASVQNQFSPAFRSSEDELAYCAKLGVAFLAWSPLGGIARADQLGSRNSAFQQVADAYGVSPQQVRLAWMPAKAPVVIPIPGASRPQSITDSAEAADLTLTPAELKSLDPPAAYHFPASLPLGALGLAGTWTDHPQEVTAGAGAALKLGFLAQHVYLLLGGAGTLDVWIGGQHTQTIDVSGTPRLYTLYQAGSPTSAKLLLRASPGVEAYDFTFG